MNNDNLAVNAVSSTDARTNWPTAEDVRPHKISFDAERCDEATIADAAIGILREEYPRLVSYGGQLYGYRAESGVFERLADDKVKRLIKSFSGAPLMGPNRKGEDVTVRLLAVSNGKVNGVVQLIHVELSDPTFFDDAPTGVAFRDSFVRVDQSGIHEELLSPAHRARYRYDFDFRGDEEATRFQKFLGDVFLDDPDHADKIAAIQEFVGAAITGLATRYERALVPFGRGANGKSTLLRMIEATMPPGSATSIAPALWGDQYQRPLLNGARLNVVPDLTDDQLGPAVKGIISGEGVAARNPGGGKAFAFKPRCAHLFACNELPKTKDTSPGFWRRWLIIEMRRNFQGDSNRDPHIVDKIVPTELPAIVRWALAGAVRLAQSGDYTLPASHSLMIDRWAGVSDPVKHYVERRTEPDDKGTSATELYDDFIRWAEPFGAHTGCGSVASMGKALTKMGVQAGRSASGVVYYISPKSGA